MLDPVNPPHSDPRNRKPWWLLFAACIAGAIGCSATDDASTHGAAGGTSAGGSNAGGAGAAAPSGGTGGAGGDAGTVTNGGGGGVAGSIGGAGATSAGGAGVVGAAGGLFEGGLGGAAGVVFQGSDAAYDGPAYTPEPSNRARIDLGQTPWKFKRVDNASQSSPTFDDSSWVDVGVPHTWNDTDTFINQDSGGGDGSMQGGTGWYRKHFTLDSKYASRKIFVEFEGVHVGAQVYINLDFGRGDVVA